MSGSAVENEHGLLFLIFRNGTLTVLPCDGKALFFACSINWVSILQDQPWHWICMKKSKRLRCNEEKNICCHT